MEMNECGNMLNGIPSGKANQEIMEAIRPTPGKGWIWLNYYRMRMSQAYEGKCANINK